MTDKTRLRLKITAIVIDCVTTAALIALMVRIITM